MITVSNRLNWLDPVATAALGAIAQLGERLDRTQEVGGSSPPSSTYLPHGSPAAAGDSSFRSESSAIRRTDPASLKADSQAFT